MVEYEPGEYAFLVLFSLCSFSILGMFNPFTPIPFTASPMVFTIIYLWSREFASQDVSIYGMVCDVWRALLLCVMSVLWC